MAWKRALVEAVCLVVMATVLGIAANHFRSEETKLALFHSYFQSPSLTQVHLSSAAPPLQAGARSQGIDPRALAPPKDPSAVYLEIDSGTAEKLHGAGALFLDARRSRLFEEGHIAGARSISVWEHDADKKVEALGAGGAAYDTVMVVYCSGGHCEDSVRLADKLALAGFLNIYVYKDGFPDWEVKGRAIRRGDSP